MRLARTLLPLLFAGGLAFAAGEARAEDGEGPPDDPRAKLKAQAEKILKLMRENESALLEASTLGGAAPKGPEVPIPDAPPAPHGSPPQGSGSGGGAQGGNAGGGPGGGPSGEEIRKRLEELIKGQQQSAGRIPGELEQLVQMIPKGQGQGGSSGQPQPGGTSEGDMTPEAREDKRKKELQEQQGQPKGKDGKDPQSAEKHEPGERGGRPPGESEVPPQQSPSDPTSRPWQTTLPPELRTSEAGGGLGKLPGRLGQIIDEYLKNLHRQTTPGATGR